MEAVHHWKNILGPSDVKKAREESPEWWVMPGSLLYTFSPLGTLLGRPSFVIFSQMWDWLNERLTIFLWHSTSRITWKRGISANKYSLISANNKDFLCNTPCSRQFWVFPEGPSQKLRPVWCSDKIVNTRIDIFHSFILKKYSLVSICFTGCNLLLFPLGET